MQLYFRLILVLFKAWIGKKTTIFKPIELPLTVLPLDLDVNRHMNNARYLALMDLGRIDFMARTGIMMKALKVHWAPVVANININFYKSLDPWQKFVLVTQMESYDEKYFYMTQKFFRGDVLCAEAQVKGLFLNREGKLPPEEVVVQTGYDLKEVQKRFKQKKA